MTWRRGRGEPLTRAEVSELNVLLLRLSLKVPELNDPAFLESLPGDLPETDESPKPKTATVSDEQAKTLSLLQYVCLPSGQGGYDSWDPVS